MLNEAADDRPRQKAPRFAIRPIAERLRNTDPAKLAGTFFQIGNYSLLALGGYRSAFDMTHHWSDLAAALLWIATSETLHRYGDDPIWFARTCVSSVVAMTLTNLAVLTTIDPRHPTICAPATAALIGTLLFAVAYGIFGAFSAPLAERFGRNDNGWIRQTLGSPRRLTGILAVVSMLSVIIDTLAARNMASRGCS